MSFTEVLRKALPQDDWERAKDMPEDLLANLYSDYYHYGPNGAAVVQFISDNRMNLNLGYFPSIRNNVRNEAEHSEFSISFLTQVSGHLMLRMPHDLRQDMSHAHNQARSRDEMIDALMMAMICMITAPACMGEKGTEWQTHHEKRYLRFMHILGLDPEAYRYKGDTVNWNDYPVWTPGGPN